MGYIHPFLRNFVEKKSITIDHGSGRHAPFPWHFSVIRHVS